MTKPPEAAGAAPLSVVEFKLDAADNRRLASLCGNLDENLELISQRTGVVISNRGDSFRIEGDVQQISAVEGLLRRLYRSTLDQPLTRNEINLQLTELDSNDSGPPAQDKTQIEIKTRRGLIRGRGQNQIKYLRNVRETDITFGVGPAGTGKTYLAVASAVDALKTGSVDRLVLVRPAVEAGERLGFLPGDMAQKVDPYLRPLYDALYEMLGFEQVSKLMDRNIIEIAPLAFMRGRTLNDAMVILDEAQNTSVEQMKMFLTRIGFGSKAIITGDVTQIDLPKHQRSGLIQAMEILTDVDGISFTLFEGRDVVRHPLVRKIVEAYAQHNEEST